jgi:hypothetical protein
LDVLTVATCWTQDSDGSQQSATSGASDQPLPASKLGAQLRLVQSLQSVWEQARAQPGASPPPALGYILRTQPGSQPRQGRELTEEERGFQDTLHGMVGREAIKEEAKAKAAAAAAAQDEHDHDDGHDDGRGDDESGDGVAAAHVEPIDRADTGCPAAAETAPPATQQAAADAPPQVGWFPFVQELLQNASQPVAGADAGACEDPNHDRGGLSQESESGRKSAGQQPCAPEPLDRAQAFSQHEVRQSLLGTLGAERGASAADADGLDELLQWIQVQRNEDGGEERESSGVASGQTSQKMDGGDETGPSNGASGDRRASQRRQHQPWPGGWGGEGRAELGGDELDTLDDAGWTQTERAECNDILECFSQMPPQAIGEDETDKGESQTGDTAWTIPQLDGAGSLPVSGGRGAASKRERGEAGLPSRRRRRAPRSVDPFNERSGQRPGTAAAAAATATSRALRCGWAPLAVWDACRCAHTVVAGVAALRRGRRAVVDQARMLAQQPGQGSRLQSVAAVATAKRKAPKAQAGRCCSGMQLCDVC